MQMEQFVQRCCFCFVSECKIARFVKTNEFSSTFNNKTEHDSYTVCPKDCGPHNRQINKGAPAYVGHNPWQMWFSHHNSYVCSLIFFYFLHVKNQINQSNSQTRKQNFCINIFDYSGHNPSHTRYVWIKNKTSVSCLRQVVYVK